MNKKLPKCLSEVKVDGDDRLTSDKKPFLIYDNNSSERILIFASEMGLKMLSETFVWHADGTFYSASKYLLSFISYLLTIQSVHFKMMASHGLSEPYHAYGC